MTGRRLVVVGLDDIVRLFKDYVGRVGFPQDAIPTRLMFNSKEKLVAVEVESEEFTGPQQPERVMFDLQRVYSVGGETSGTS